MVTHQLQVERRTGKVRQSETDVLPLCYATNSSSSSNSTDRTDRTKTLDDASVRVLNFIFKKSVAPTAYKIHMILFRLSPFSGVDERRQMGQVPPDAASEGRKTVSPKYVITNIKGSMIRFAE